MNDSPRYRKIFPSYDWSEDVWRVNQIINMPIVYGKEKMGFIKGIENETIKQGDAAIRSWIDTNMKGCSCYILFVGEKTHTSRWVKYEMELSYIRKMGKLIIKLDGMLNQYGESCKGGIDPYWKHGMYTDKYSDLYSVKEYYWIENNGVQNIGTWIDMACRQIGR